MSTTQKTTKKRSGLLETSQQQLPPKKNQLPEFALVQPLGNNLEETLHPVNLPSTSSHAPFSTHNKSTLQENSATYQRFIDVTAYKPGDIIPIPLTQIDPNPRNSRKIYNEADIQILEREILRDGQLVPALVTPNQQNEERFVCIDGYTRYLALKRTKVPSLKALVVDITDELEMYRQSFKLNDARQQTTDFDNGLAWAELLRDGLVKDQDDLSALVGRNKSMISRTMCFSKLPPSLLEFIGTHKEKISTRFAYEIFLLFTATKSPEKAMRFADAIVTRDLSARDAEKLRMKLQATEQHPVRNLRTRQVALKYDGKRAGFIKEWEDSGRIVIDAQRLTIGQRERIRDFVLATIHDDGVNAE
jgi:ParB family transcriptional regulator, chromosome partitioning protein